MLSDREERIIAEIEQQLTDDDPRFVKRARKVHPAGGSRKLTWAIVGFVLGLLSLFGLVFHIGFGIAGFGLMFVSVVIGVPELQRRREQMMQDSEPF